MRALPASGFAVWTIFVVSTICVSWCFLVTWNVVFGVVKADFDFLRKFGEISVRLLAIVSLWFSIVCSAALRNCSLDFRRIWIGSFSALLASSAAIVSNALSLKYLWGTDPKFIAAGALTLSVEIALIFVLLRKQDTTSSGCADFRLRISFAAISVAVGKLAIISACPGVIVRW